MIYERCQCGKMERWQSGMPAQPCQGCEECQTTPSGHPAGHTPLVPHEWEPRYDVRTGEPNKRLCRRCYKIEKVEPCSSITPAAVKS